MLAARSGHGGHNSIGGGQGVPFADRVGASWRGRSVGRMAGQRAGCRRQAGRGKARNRARARLNWFSQGQRWGRCKVRRRAERVSCKRQRGLVEKVGLEADLDAMFGYNVGTVCTGWIGLPTADTTGALSSA